ncbi:HsdM family class I SAM-dependent methyltransferase [Acinetobacter pragensis]|uniref:HsdM family class I SAM-dependent methyltransferase n=1 Tax=Acinetobacter pragensis TaxID=1806892 RepID=UPI00333F5B99
MKNTIEYLDVLSTMTGTMTRSAALELFTLISYLVKENGEESKKIVLSTHDNISFFISDYVTKKELHWFPMDIVRWNTNQLVNIIQVFLSLRTQCSNDQDYGEKAFEVLKAFALNSNKNWDMFNVDSQNILNVFKVVVGSVEDKLLYDGACGLGFLAHELNPKQSILRDINDVNVGMAKLLYALTEKNADIQRSDLLSEECSSYGVDLVVSTPPINVRVSEAFVQKQNYLKELFINARIPTSASESLWIQQALYHLNVTGKTYLQIIPGWLFRGGYDAELREKLVQLNWVEAVILLPAGILADSNIEMSLLILNKAKVKETIRLVDARSFGERQRRKLNFSLFDAEKVKELLTCDHDTEWSKDVTIQQVKANKYSLHCSEYIDVEIEVEQLDFEHEMKLLEDKQVAYESVKAEFNQLLKTI